MVWHGSIPKSARTFIVSRAGSLISALKVLWDAQSGRDPPKPNVKVLRCVHFWIIYLKFARENHRRERGNARDGATISRRFSRTSCSRNLQHWVDVPSNWGIQFSSLGFKSRTDSAEVKWVNGPGAKNIIPYATRCTAHSRARFGLQIWRPPPPSVRPPFRPSGALKDERGFRFGSTLLLRWGGRDEGGSETRDGLTPGYRDRWNIAIKVWTLV